MRIKSVRLRGYKRFTDLTIEEIPESARLVVMIGPNGSGKSSVFDGFLVKSQETRGNYGLQGERAEYYDKVIGDLGISGSTHDVARKVTIHAYGSTEATIDWAKALYIRTAYRHQPDFRVDSVERVTPASEQTRFTRIIDRDEAVSDNYSRMVWKLLSDQFMDEYQQWMIGTYHRRFLDELQAAITALFPSPGLELQDFGGPDRMGSFRFAKGATRDFHYKNLSGGEKAAFDLLLDLFIKRGEYGSAIYCIDEPEAHLATPLHGKLLDAILSLLPGESQLWIATHSVGFARRAYERMRSHGDVVFLDFSNPNLDEPIVLKPRVPDASFWRAAYRVALDDLADLIAPQNIVLCEGHQVADHPGFDAQCYMSIFGDTHPETLFVGRGGANDVRNSENLMALLGSVARGMKVWRLTDRDEMVDGERERMIDDGIQVLTRREIENYLYDPAVLRSFLIEEGKDALADQILEGVRAIVPDEQIRFGDVKAQTQAVLQLIRQQAGIPNLGNSRQEFALAHLAPALKKTPDVFQELERDVFPSTPMAGTGDYSRP